MIKKFLLLVCNNYIGLGVTVYFRHLLILFLSLYAGLLISFYLQTYQIWFILFDVVKASAVYLLLVAFVMAFWRYKSAKIGFKSIVIFPGSEFWLKKMLVKRNIYTPILESCIEIHVNTRRRYKSMDDYNAVIDADIKRLTGYLNCCRFGNDVTVVFNSFNRQLIDKLENEFGSHSIRVSQTALPEWISKTYHPRHFKKIQRKMFGEVKSNRAVYDPKEWELFIYNFSLKGGTAV